MRWAHCNANWAGLGFIVLAFVLFVLDIKAPTHGVLTVGGIATLHLRLVSCSSTRPN